MQPVITVEFTARAGDQSFKEENVTFHNPEDLFAFVATHGGCDAIPNEVAEIRMVFLPPENPNTQNVIADLPASLQLGMVFFNGPLSEITNTAEQILDRAGRGELSGSFLKIIGASR